MEVLKGVGKTPGAAGEHRNGGSNSFGAIGAALIPSTITAILFILAFLVLRPRFKNIYAPRTFFRSISRKDRTPSSSRSSFSWFHDFRNLDDKFVLRHSSMEAYLFLRYLRMVVLICVVGCCLTWPVLFAINATGGGGASETDKISFGNVLNSKKLYAHAIVAWIFFAFIVLLVTRERLFVVGLRQAYLTIPLNATRLSSRVVLYLSVPPEGLLPENLQRYFGKDAVKAWVVSNVSHLEKLVKTRDGKIDKLEGLELELLKKANKAGDDTEDSFRITGPAARRPPQVDDEQRPKRRSPPVVGEEVDPISQLREEITDIVYDVDQARQAESKEAGTKTGAVFVEFKDQVSAHQAFQLIQHPSPLALQPKYIGVRPKEIIWSNLNLDPSLRITYSYLATALALAIIIFWSIPVGIIGTISNIEYLTDKFEWLRFLNKLPDPIMDLLTGLLPPLLLSSVVSYVPYFYEFVATLSGVPTSIEAIKWVQTWYFVFQVIQVFLITTFSSGAAAVANKIANEPTKLPKLLAKNLPKASNFYLTYFIIQGLGTASQNIVNISGLASYLFFYYVMAKTPRQKFNAYAQMRNINWFNLYPKFTNLAVIAIAYSCIAPLVLGFAAIGIYFLYVSYRYYLLYVVQVKSETRGESYTRTLQQLMTGVYVAEICLFGLFSIKKAAGPSTLTILLLIVTGLYHLTVNKYLSPLETYIPVDVLAEDEEEPLLNGDGDITDHSRIFRVGAGKVPSVLLDPLASFLEPHIFASQEALRPWLEDPEGEFAESNSYTDEQVENAYVNPVLISKTPEVWIPRDRKGVSKIEIEENGKAGIPSTDDGAELGPSNEILWDREDFSTVPIFKEPTRF
ncbi:hypothetical protein EDD37DRAFT_140719 [Exophiala viscosa]|uniref:uncharacterized protein n=1 Tax=Exophiala viscosa TaxID=2486360 RepID=UPI0021997453|nr:hypothetical protein EDD37DRAFT_140719 [Exophiala viscosa]